MSRNKYFLILFFFAFQSILLKAQFENLSFERIDADQGLPNCNIEEAIEDHFGFLWFATCEGLFRYDGYEFKAYRHDVKDSTYFLTLMSIHYLKTRKEICGWGRLVV